MAKKSLLKQIRWKRFLVFLLSVYCLVSFAGGIVEIYELKQQKKDLDAQLQDAEIERDYWQNRVDNMSSDMEIERVAREKLGLVYPGEVALKKAEGAKE